MWDILQGFGMNGTLEYIFNAFSTLSPHPAGEVPSLAKFWCGWLVNGSNKNNSDTFFHIEQNAYPIK